MDVRQILDETERIRQIAQRWSAEGKIPFVERDMVLDKLRRIYEAVLLDEGGASDGTGRSAAVCVPEAGTSGGETVADVSASDGAGACACEEMEAAALSGESDPGADVGSASEGSVPDAPKSFGDEPFVRSRMDKKRVILSLYGDDAPIIEHKTTHTSTTVYRSVSVAAGEPLPEAPTEEEAPQEAEEPSGMPDTPGEDTGGYGGRKVLGEVIGGGGVAFNEVLGRRNAHADVVSKLQQARSIDDLRQSVGINDKFLLIRDLFGGDSASYESEMDALNAFEDLDQALIYVQERYGANPESEGLKLVVELLERKLGY